MSAFNVEICKWIFLNFIILNILTKANTLPFMIRYINVDIPIYSSLVKDGVNQTRCSIKDIMKADFNEYKPNLNIHSFNYKSLNNLVEMGGKYEPKCIPIQRVAIIVPYRKRKHQLDILVYNLHQFLIKQNLVDYRLFVVQQDDYSQFNRAKLFNVGFKEALQVWHRIDCFIFHDVELVPTNYKNLYLCSTQPRHMSYNIDGFTSFYEQIFGGVSAIQTNQIVSVNGFSNLFFGWGGEDDEMRIRLTKHGYTIERLFYNISTYIKLPHGKDDYNDANPLRYKLIQQSSKTYLSDGLNSLVYKLKNIQEYKFYTIIKADLSK